VERSVLYSVLIASVVQIVACDHIPFLCFCLVLSLLPPRSPGLAEETDAAMDGEVSMSGITDGGGAAHGAHDGRNSSLGILGLPDEIILTMLAFLPIESLCNVVRTCRRFQGLGTTKAIQSTTRFPAECWPFLSKPASEADAEGEGESAVPPSETGKCKG
jgi:hypothetical protein